MNKIVICWILLIQSLPGYAQNDCDKALEFKDIVQMYNVGKTTKDIHTWLKSRAFREYANSSDLGGGITFPIDGVPINFNANSSDADYQKLYNAIDRGDSYFFTNEFKQTFFKKTLKEKAYDVWLECIRIKATTQPQLIKEENNLIGVISDEGEDFFILKLKWKPHAGINSVKLRQPIIVGAQCADNSLFQNEISSEFISIPFYRDKEKEVRIVLNTIDNRGSLNLKLPRVNVQIEVNTEPFSLPTATYLIYGNPLDIGDEVRFTGVPVRGQFNVDPIIITMEIDAIRKTILSSVLKGSIKFSVLSVERDVVDIDEIPVSRHLNFKRWQDSYDNNGNATNRQLLKSNVDGLIFYKRFWGREIKKSNDGYEYGFCSGHSKRFVPAFNEETPWSGETNYKIYLRNVTFSDNIMRCLLVVETGFPISVVGTGGSRLVKDSGKTKFSQNIEVRY